MANTILNFHFDYWNPSLTCLAVLGSSISRSLCLTVRAYRAIIRVILACHFPEMFLFQHCFQDSARNKSRSPRRAGPIEEPGQEGLLNISSRCHGLICPGEPEAVWPNLLRLVNRASSISPLNTTTSGPAHSGGDLAQTSGCSSGPPHFSPQSATVLPMPPF